jgi:hypothetical protein
MGQRQRMSTARSLVERPEELVESSTASTSGTIPEDEAMDVDGINAMMAGVKSRGVGFCLSEFCALTDIRYTPGQGIIEVRQGSVGLIALGGCWISYLLCYIFTSFFLIFLIAPTEECTVLHFIVDNNTNQLFECDDRLFIHNSNKIARLKVLFNNRALLVRLWSLANNGRLGETVGSVTTPYKKRAHLT